MTDLAPILMFVYNRPEHTRQTLEALRANDLANASELIVYSDAAASQQQADAVREVRAYLGQVDGFKSIKLVERPHNFGLAASIIDGVTTVVNEFGRVIVVEDDLETAPFFLSYMNTALSYYEDNPRVMHISGCRYPAEPFGDDDTFFLRVPLCWGWATWRRAWIHFSKDLDLMSEFDAAMISRFNFDDSYRYWRQLEHNESGKLNTWFIFWYATLFLRDGLALFPARSLVRNIGVDGSGENSRNSSDYEVELSNTPIRVEQIPCVESRPGFDAHRDYFRKIRKTVPQRLLRKLHKVFNSN